MYLRLQILEQMIHSLLHLAEIGEFGRHEHHTNRQIMPFRHDKFPDMETIAFTKKPFHPVTVNSMTKPFLRDQESDFRKRGFR